MRKMNPEVKAIWLVALRSGEYKKGEGSLYSRTIGGDVCHCALGVLCEEAAKLGKIEVNDGSYSFGRFVSRPDPGHLIPAEVYTWADTGEFEDIEFPVMQRNDQYLNTTTFNDVADFIEEHF